MTVTVRQLAEWVGGELLGDGETVIRNARALSDAGPGDVTFVESDRRLPAWHACPASAAVVHPTAPVNGRPVIRVPDPLMAFAVIVQHLRGKTAQPVGTIHPTAVVDPSATVGPNAAIGPFVVIEAGAVVGANCSLLAGAVIGTNCRLGDNVTVHPHVVLYDGTVLGDRVVVHANAVIGADGFGYRNQRGKHVKVPQQGWVEVGSDVEIGACTTIDRGTFGPTVIGCGTKIDNLVMVAHNCQIGRHNILAGQVGVAGSVTTGDHVVMAGQVGVADHLTVGEGALLGARTGVVKDVLPASRMFGYPAKTDREQHRIVLSLEKLPELRRDVRQIKQHLGLGEAS